MDSENTCEKDVVAGASSSLKRKADECNESMQNLKEQNLDVNELCVSRDEDSRNVHVPSSSKIHGFHLMPTCLRYRDPPSEKLEAKLSNDLKSSKFVADFKAHWKTDTVLIDKKIEIIVDPWKVCVLNDVLENDAILQKIRSEFYELYWNRRKMDLYDFHQSLDLKHIDSHGIHLLYDFLKNEVMPWISDLMQVKLNKISATCSFYTDGDYLLVHDDQQEDRVVAFVLYLSDAAVWENNWGGALELFDRDEYAQPSTPKRLIYPRHNQLVIFPVSSISYHQVQEVTTKNYSRLSINGWFHGKREPSKITPKFIAPSTGVHSDNFLRLPHCSVDLKAWISDQYLAESTMAEIQEQIQEYSEISLVNFFHENKFAEVLKALQKDTNKWKLMGPPNRFRYEVLDEESLPSEVCDFLNVFKSGEMFDLLHMYTDLDINKNGNQIRYELQRWTPGCYTLLSDYEWNKRQELDVIMFLGCQRVVGGEIQYVVQDEEEVQQALITLPPCDNTLNIVFRDTARITSYVSKATSSAFYILICCYAEIETV